MAQTPNSTTIDFGGVGLREIESMDGLLTLTSGPSTIKAGTILARDSVSLKFVPYAIGGSTNGNGIPKAVLLQDVVDAGTGTHDVPVRPAIKGVVNRNRLIVFADGTGANLTTAIEDSLRAFGITPVAVQQLSV
jgi:hypothetical protein